MSSGFVHLHVHSCFSFLDGTSTPEELERPERLAHRRARDIELLGQLVLWRELVARLQLAPFEEPLDLRDDPLVEPVAPDGL